MTHNKGDILLIAWLILLTTSLVTAYDERCPSDLDGDVDVFECKCYQITEKTDTEWDNIKCSRHGGRLAAVNTSALNQYLKSTIRSVRPDEDHGFWIGGNRATKESDWHWIDGTPLTFTNWAPGEPNHIELKIITIEQNCIYMSREHQFSWSSVQCDLQHIWSLPSICQYDIPDCLLDMPGEKISTVMLIGIVVGAVVGGLLLCLLLCCLIVRCKTYCVKYRKRKQRQRSVKYYSRPPSLSGSHRSGAGQGRCRVDSGDNEAGENDLNEQLMAASRAEEGTSNGRPQLGAGLPDDDDDEVLNVKGPLPTADSIAQDIEARKGLVVDVNTGKATIKRTNEPPNSLDPGPCAKPTKTRADNASTRSLKSFKLDGGDVLSNQLSHEDDGRLSSIGSQSSVEDNSELISSNLDNMDKPSSHPSKDLGYK